MADSEAPEPATAAEVPAVAPAAAPEDGVALPTRKRKKPVEYKPLPHSAVKRLMKLSPNGKGVAADSVPVLAQAAESFVSWLSLAGYEQSKAEGRRSLQYEDLFHARRKYQTKCHFLDTVLPAPEVVHKEIKKKPVSDQALAALAAKQFKMPGGDVPMCAAPAPAPAPAGAAAEEEEEEEEEDEEEEEEEEEEEDEEEDEE